MYVCSLRHFETQLHTYRINGNHEKEIETCLNILLLWQPEGLLLISTIKLIERTTHRSIGTKFSY